MKEWTRKDEFKYKPAAHFHTLVGHIDLARKVSPLEPRRPKKDQETIDALIWAALQVLNLSGCWHPDDMIANSNPEDVALLEKAMREEGLA